jgi:phosphomannomutase
MSARLLSTQTWNGVYTTEFSLQEIRQRCQSLIRILLDRNLHCLVAYDTRFMAELFARDIYQTMVAQGVGASLSQSPAPLPAIYYALAQGKADCALVVSARNQPYWSNGLVLIGNDLPPILRDPDITSGTGAPFPPTVEPTTESGSKIIDLRSPYIDMLRSPFDLELIRRASLTVFADSMNGSSAGYLPAVIAGGGQTRAIEINKETDPLFSRTTPMPGTSGLTRLRKLVRESDSHVGLAFSADGTALGVVDKNGNSILPIEVALLLAAYLNRQYRQRGMVLLAPPAQHSDSGELAAALHTWANNLGVQVELSNQIDTRLAEVLANQRPHLLLGCTDAGQIVIGQHGTYADALFAGVMLIELIARNAGNLLSLLEELRQVLQIQKSE